MINLAIAEVSGPAQKQTIAVNLKYRFLNIVSREYDKIPFEANEFCKRLIIKATHGVFWRPRREGTADSSPDDAGDGGDHDDEGKVTSRKLHINLSTLLQS